MSGVTLNMKFKIVLCAIICSSLFATGYIYLFSVILNKSVVVSNTNELMGNIYYIQLGYFSNPNNMIGILGDNNIQYQMYEKDGFTYFISGVSSDKQVTENELNTLKSKGIECILKEVDYDAIDDTYLKNAIDSFK